MNPHFARRWLALLPLLFACGSDTGDTAADTEDDPVSLAVFAGCENEFHRDCDVLDAECQARLFATARCLRHQPDAVLPEVRVISKTELIAEISTESARATEASGDAALDEAAANEVVSRALELLGLAERGELSEQNIEQLFIDTVPAYYSDVQHLITIVDDGAGGASQNATLTLVHEFVHALQDQDRSLEQLNAEQAPSYDAYLAALSVAEGEATMLESFVDAAQWGFDEDPDFRSYYTSWVPDAEAQFAGQSPLLVSPRYFPYSYGARYVFDVVAGEGMSGVRSRFASPPDGVLAMLLNAAGPSGIEAESLESLPLPDVPSGFQPHEPDRFGPWIFGKFLERVLPEAAGSSLASHWRGDRFLAWSSDDRGIAALWTIRLDTEQAASELFEPARAATLAGRPSPNAFCARVGRDVTIGITDISVTRDVWRAVAEGETPESSNAAEMSAAASDAEPLEPAPAPNAAAARARRRLGVWHADGHALNGSLRHLLSPAPPLHR